ncbi:MAG: nucleotidyltransferase domain-containing protein [Nannocystaceae bacterium]
MRTISQAFHDFISDLELKDREQSDAKTQHAYLREKLQQKMDVEDNFLSGSYARNTATRPLNDIDIFLVLRPSQSMGPQSAPSSVLTQVKRALEEIHHGKTAIVQSRSVNIEFSGTGIAYDIVPAYLDRDDVYRIPDRDVNDWILTNPRRHKEMSTEANERAGKMLKPLLKAVKRSNYEHRGTDESKPARSFHLEVLSWSILTAKPADHLSGVITLLTGLADKVCEPCPDPAGFGSAVQPSAARCRQAQTWLQSMLVLAQDAKQLSADGRTGEAHGQLRELFGADWPEKGTPSGKGSAGPAIIVGGGAPDDSRSRFG